MTVWDVCVGVAGLAWLPVPPDTLGHTHGENTTVKMPIFCRPHRYVLTMCWVGSGRWRRKAKRHIQHGASRPKSAKCTVLDVPFGREDGAGLRPKRPAPTPGAGLRRRRDPRSAPRPGAWPRTCCSRTGPARGSPPRSARGSALPTVPRTGARPRSRRRWGR